MRGLALGLVVLLGGCATLPLAVGMALDATVGGVGIWQREQHRRHLERIDDQLYRLRVPVVVPTAEVLREREEAKP